MDNRELNILELSTGLQADLLRRLQADSTQSDMLTMVVDSAAGALDASASSIFIIEPNRARAVQRAGTGYHRQFVDQVCDVVSGEEEAEQRRCEGRKLGLTGYILSTGKSILAYTWQDLKNHPHRTGDHDPERLPGEEELVIQTFLGVPLRDLTGEVIGLIKGERRVGQSKSTEPFSVADQIVLETFGRVASRCLHYLRMVKEGLLDRAITSWARDIISEAVATEGELDSFLDIVVAVSAAAMRADSCAIYLIDENKKTLTQRAGIGSQGRHTGIRSYVLPEKDQIQHAQTDDPNQRVGLTAWIAAMEESHYAPSDNRRLNHPHHRGEYDPVNFARGTVCGAFLGVPLKVGGRTIGVFKVENIRTIGLADDRNFEPQDRQRYEILAQDIALDIERLRLQSHSRYKVIDGATPTIFKILGGNMSVQELVSMVVTATAKLFNAHACALFLHEGEDLVQPPWAAYGWAKRGPEVRNYRLILPEMIKMSPREDEKVGLTVWIAVTKQAFTARSNLELRLHPHHRGTFDIHNFDGTQKCESFMGVPLLVGETLVGVLKVETKIKQISDDLKEFTFFTEQDELVFRLIASSVAIAIQNARFREAEKLADRIRNQPQLLLIELHNFARERWHPIATLKQAAELLRDKLPRSAEIVDYYAALLQPQFGDFRVDAFLNVVKAESAALDTSAPLLDLYGIFKRALGVRSLQDVSRFCAARDVFTNPDMLDPHFFLVDGARVLRELTRSIAASLLGENREDTSVTPLQRVVVHLDEARDKTANLAQPEREIVRRIVDRWRQMLKEALREFGQPSYTIAAVREFRRIKNPYIAGPPIEPRAGSPFFGRRDIFDWVAENLHSATQKNILVLHGARRTGKTSILLQLDRGPLGEPLRNRTEQPLYPVYISMQEFPDQGTELFLRGLAQRIAAVPALHGKIKLPRATQFAAQRHYETFRSFLAGVSRAVGDGLLVVMIDEFEGLEERVKNNKIDGGIFQFLRYQMQFQPNITFILAGWHQLSEMSQEYQSLAFDSALPRQIGFMGKEDAVQLIRDPVGDNVTYDDLAVERLWELTFGHPYFLQLLCQRVVSDMNRKQESNFVTAPDINTAVEGLLKDSIPQIQWMWEQLQPAQQAVLALMSETEKGVPIPRSAITHSLANKGYLETVVNDALGQLSAQHLIASEPLQAPRPEEPLYQSKFDLLRLWIRYYHPILADLV